MGSDKDSNTELNVEEGAKYEAVHTGVNKTEETKGDVTGEHDKEEVEEQPRPRVDMSVLFSPFIATNTYDLQSSRTVRSPMARSSQRKFTSTRTLQSTRKGED
jgi:hypothetical protein